jgi:hypothetical protein
VLEFIRRDLDGMTADELKAMGDDLLHATAPWVVDDATDTVEWMRGIRTCIEGMPAAQVRILQQEIQQCVQTVMGEPIDDWKAMSMIHAGHANPQGWVRPEARTHLVRWRPSRQLPYRIVEVREGTTVRAAILNGVADLLIALSPRLKACNVCGSTFLARYRQEFCHVRCSNKVRNRRRLDRKAAQKKPQLTTV